MEQWTTSELVEQHKDEITRLFLQGDSRGSIARKITDDTGRLCTDGVIRHVLVVLDLSRTKQRTEPIEMVDTTDSIDEQPIEELIASRVKASRRKMSAAKKHKKTIELEAKPIGILVMGDPHVDNEGCDWGTLLKHVELVQKTEGAVASCVGDMQDHWVGRLGRCYADSSAKASDGWRLSEWLLNSMQWLSLVGGNHDSWASVAGLDPYEWLTKKCGVMCYAADEIRITLKWKNEPDLEPVIWVLRHDFSGRSWYHPTHGPHKEATLDGKAHLLTAGHIHQWGELTTEQRHGRITTALRVRGYKRADSYARQKGFSEQQHGESAFVVIDPYKDGPGRIQVFWDVETGCEYLTMLRGKVD